MIATFDGILNLLASVSIVLLMVPVALTVLRMIRGPGYADRFIALDMLTGLVVAIAALTAAVTGRREFLDVGFGVALVSFVATCALAAFLEQKGRDPK